MSDNISPLVMIPVTRIDPHPLNPRRDLGDLGDLTKSIKAQGIRQNLLLVEARTCAECGCTDDHACEGGCSWVDDETDLCTACEGTLRPNGWEPKPTRYTVVIGHRRLAAAVQAGLTEVPASIADLTDAQQLELMLVENVQRTDLTPIEEAEGLQGLLDLGVTQAGIAKATGIGAKTIKGRLQLLTLPETAQAKIHAGQATLADAVALEEFADDPDVQNALAAMLGTPNYAVQVQAVKSSRARLAALQPIIDRLVERGAVKHVRGPGADEVKRKWGGQVSSVSEADEVFLPEGSTYEPSEYTRTVTVFVPVAKVEGVDEGTPYVPYVDEDRAEREARWQVEREHVEALQAQREAAHAVRDQWVREFSTMGKPTVKETGVIVAAAADHLLVSGYWPDAYDLAEWIEPDRTRADDVTDVDVCQAWGKGLAPSLVLLVGMHVAVGNWPGPDDVLVFDALEACGYVVSDLERGWLQPPAEAAQDEAEAV